MNRRGFVRGLLGACVAVTAAGRLALQPDLTPESLTRFAELESVIEELTSQVRWVWEERMRQAMLDRAVHGVAMIPLEHEG